LDFKIQQPVNLTPSIEIEEQIGIVVVEVDELLKKQR
jgi:hypothetical protein